MNPISLYIFAFSTLSAFINSDSQSIENAASANPPHKNLQNQPPLCIYPPPPPSPSSTLEPPGTPTATPAKVAPPSPTTKTGHGSWCVAKPAVPAPTIQQALDYACSSGADCQPIQVNGACYEPNTVHAHSSFAFNSYWQKNKMAGGTCDFGGSATLVSVDPSYDQCHFPSA